MGDHYCKGTAYKSCYDLYYENQDIQALGTRKNVLLKVLLLITIFFIGTKTMAQMNPQAETHISKMLAKEVPYQVKILDYNFFINSVHTYPPGKLTAMFAKFLIDKQLLKNKVVADIGAGCFALGIIAAKNGASTVIGTDINDYAMQCAKDNLVFNDITEKAYLFKGAGLSPLLPNFIAKIDVLLSGAPWDSISNHEFENLSHKRKPISRAFYDVNDELITSVFSQGFELLTPNGKIFTTSSMKAIERIKKLCLKHKLSYKIVKEADLHNDGNIHYILEITHIPKFIRVKSLFLNTSI